MGALVMFALAIIIANVAGIYYWRQDRKEKKVTRYNNSMCRYITEKDRFHRLPFLVYSKFFIAS